MVRGRLVAVFAVVAMVTSTASGEPLALAGKRVLMVIAPQVFTDGWVVTANGDRAAKGVAPALMRVLDSERGPDPRQEQ